MVLGKLSAFKNDITGPLLFIALFTGFGGLQLGYDNSWWSVMMALPQFAGRFGGGTVTLPTGLSYRTVSTMEQSISTSFPYVFQLIGGLAGGQLAERYGRVMPLNVTAITFILATVLQMTSSVNGYRFWQMVMGKFIVAAAGGGLLVSVPLYIAELAPKSIRGALVGIVAWTVVLGSLLAACVMYGVSTKAGQIVWLLPTGLQLPLPIILLVVARFLPESPRWLLARGRSDEALVSLKYVRTRSSPEAITSEFAEMRESIASEACAVEGTWRDVFKSRNALRTHIATGVSSFGPAQGFSFITSYLVLFFVQIGIKNPLQLNIYINVMIVFVVILSVFAQDFLGRRVLLIGSTLAMGIAMFLLAGITTKTPAPIGSKADVCIFAIFLWVLGYTLGWASGPVIVGTEVPAQYVRDKTYAMSVVCASSVQAITAGATAPIQEALGGQIGFIYGSISLIALVWLWFLLPDLKNKSMDEIDWLFEHDIPLRKMGSTDIPALRETSDVTAENDDTNETDVEKTKAYIEHREMA